MKAIVYVFSKTLFVFEWNINVCALVDIISLRINLKSINSYLNLRAPLIYFEIKRSELLKNALHPEQLVFIPTSKTSNQVYQTQFPLGRVDRCQNVGSSITHAKFVIQIVFQRPHMGFNRTKEMLTRSLAIAMCRNSLQSIL